MDVRKKLMFLFVTVVCLLHLLTAETFAGSWRLDSPAEELLPRNLRLSSDDLAAEAPILKSGLAVLCISGSAQPSQPGLQSLYQRLRAETALPIYLVDLREESHGFFAEAAISWYEDHNWGNRGKTASASLQDEKQMLHAIAGTVRAVPLGREDTALFAAQELQAETAITEECAATAAGFRYIRFTATDQCWPDCAVVDDFLHFYKSLPSQPVWIHFHCQAGHGRTTIFMVLYDILRNPQLSLDNIVLRQQLLGGTDLLFEPGGMDWLAVENRRRAEFLRLFYRYVQEEQMQGFPLDWSDWLAQQSLPTHTQL